MVELSVIIISWNTKRSLVRTLQSLQRYPPNFKYDVWVVDNNSSDGTVDYLRRKFRWIKLIANSKNLGFAKANNQILERIHSPYVLILNPDTRLTRGCIDLLHSFLQNHPEIGACGSLLLNEDGSPQRNGYYRKLPSLLQTILFYTETRKLSVKYDFLVHRFWETKISKISLPIEVDQIPGACIFANIRTLKRIGFFDEDYFLWFEDVDLCFRLRKAGYKLMLIPQSKVFHTGGASFKKWTDDVVKQIQFFKSLLIYFRKHFSLPTSFFVKTIVLIDLSYLLITRSIRQIYAFSKNRKLFIENKWRVFKWLLVS